MDLEMRDRWLNRAQDRVAGAGLRAGAARSAVIELLAREGQCLLIVAELTQMLRSQPVGSAASVYRAVDELFELGLLHRLDGRDGVARYEIADPEHHHHHLVDEGTGDVVAFADQEFERAIHALAERLDVELTGHDVVLRGRRRS
ncbi:transcriptional repressor [Solirubrobacter sp. CPCC 204708]|uniref:Transcriptional repressor n=1 Tax=Solirubrobacter deserti TaxID=2282478 RepID=A0ABT4RQJ8_9ACTN|nr:transcriptional repressor [Solirubrobacter deserti]MBE2316673.1 transcriptional repressor [Solirubrobacter deserti]MDA0140571.1 transcriptional repressor [Solirubrobacter deserti]